MFFACTWGEERIVKCRILPDDRLEESELVDGEERVLLNAHNRYSPASALLDNGRLIVASKTQIEIFAQRLPYEIHVCDPVVTELVRPGNLESNEKAKSFSIKPEHLTARPIAIVRITERNHPSRYSIVGS